MYLDGTMAAASPAVKSYAMDAAARGSCRRLAARQPAPWRALLQLPWSPPHEPIPDRNPRCGDRVTLLFGALNLASSLVTTFLTGVAYAGRAVGGAAVRAARGESVGGGSLGAESGAAAPEQGGPAGTAAAAAAGAAGASGDAADGAPGKPRRPPRTDAANNLLLTGISVYVALVGSLFFFARA